MKARLWPWIVLAVVVIGVLVWAAWPGDSTRTDAERTRDLSSELRCPDCEALSVADSSTDTARAIRRDIRTRVEHGQSDAAIRQAYVDRYGESILLEPGGDGLGLLVWGLPVVALVLGGGGLVLALRRWRDAPRLHATEADEKLVESTRTES
jgi:cytochrome c-type biogenesis protein CcmH